MAKRSVKTAGFSGYEKICGGLLLVCYLTVFPLLAGRVFDWTEFLLGGALKEEFRDAVYYTHPSRGSAALKKALSWAGRP